VVSGYQLVARGLLLVAQRIFLSLRGTKQSQNVESGIRRTGIRHLGISNLRQEKEGQVSNLA
jgi:hypothetical protein